MLKVIVLVLSFLPVWASAEILTCEQQQTVCNSQCQVSNIGDESGLASCKAKCLGKRTSCAFKKGAESAKDVWENSDQLRKELGDKARAFWEGFNE